MAAETFRKFKRHYHLTKRACFEAADDGGLSFRISHKRGEPVTYEETAPERDKIARFAALIYSFLNEQSEVHYRKILDLIKRDYPKVTTTEDLEEIVTAVERIENGVMSFSINRKEFNAKGLFELVAKAGYFERDEEAVKVFEDLQKMPLAFNLVWYQFKAYVFDAFRVISVIFDLIRGVENHEEYRDLVRPAESQLKRCIYCLKEECPFNSEEHIFPESLAGDAIYLPPGFVCDPCNHGISSLLDNALMSFEPIAFLMVQFTPFTKRGKFPKANFGNMTMEKTDPNHIKIVAKNKSGTPKNKRTLEDGSEAFTLAWTGKKLDWKVIARAVYKIALGFVAYDLGHETALDERYNPVRDFIVNGSPFPNNMIVSTKSKPHPSLRSHSDMGFGGTPFFIDIFGMMFFLNLEEFPKLEIRGEMKDLLNAISDNYEFEIFPLNR
ncbi:MAG: hypothetical protein ACKVQW_03975 [Pyrinomonadaceae bacterium]